ncbi:MAG: prephenate dehydrogenase/arogenate dehydrogenase family protein [Gammaproteobacteria bacterium]|nr:prephenate dehydrogenase/arogenate dehydrogenase family protein [Gammaproteobacteria bacterium]
MIRKLCIIGVGLIGGSLARALKRARYCEEVVGVSRRESHLREALELGVIDHYELDIGRAVAGADMVVACVPLGVMRHVFAAMVGHLTDDAVVTDGGSAKVSVIEAARQAFGELPATFVPAHPVAGTEKSGVSASFAELFDDRRVIITPPPEAAADAVRRVEQMWLTAGAKVEQMGAQHHDEVLAATSHLPHLLAYNLVDVLGRMEEWREMFRFAAGGFHDFTRIASSDPLMWHDICLNNREAVLFALRHFTADLARLEAAVEAGDGDYLTTVFTRAKDLRDRYTQSGAV